MDTIRQWITRSPEETRCLGQHLGQCLQRGTILRLYGDLGSGKTCLVQGLARGLAVPAGYDITSPTYTLIHEYPTPTGPRPNKAGLFITSRTAAFPSCGRSCPSHSHP